MTDQNTKEKSAEELLAQLILIKSLSTEGDVKIDRDILLEELTQYLQRAKQATVEGITMYLEERFNKASWIYSLNRDIKERFLDE